MAQHKTPDTNFTALDEPYPKSRFPLFITSFTILTLVSIITAIFFYFQSLPLKQELALVPMPSTPTPAETSQQAILDSATTGWSTYTNPTDRFSFKYPATMTQSLYQESDLSGVQLIIIGPTQMASGRTQSSLAEGLIIKTLMLPNTDAQSAAQSMHQTDSQTLDTDPSPQVSPIRTLTLDGSQAYQYDIESMGNATITYLQLNQDTLKITGLYSGFTDSQLQSYKSLHNQILSTFKILSGSCGTCPILVPPAPDFCQTGAIIPGGTDACGCPQPPTCQPNSN